MAKMVRVLLPVHGEGIVGDVSIEISKQCATCRHWLDGLTCEAFPEGIPDEIIFEGRDHTEPFKGDRGIRYEHH